VRDGAVEFASQLFFTICHDFLAQLKEVNCQVAQLVCNEGLPNISLQQTHCGQLKLNDLREGDEMTLDDVKKFMKEVEFGFLATTSGDSASVRPMGGWAWVDRELWCCTVTHSCKAKDVSKKPNVEYCFSNANGNHVRIGGTCAVSVLRDDKAKLLSIHPGLENYVGDADSPTYAVLRLKVQRIRSWVEENLDYAEVSLG
jgi:general stress protein 26